MTDNQLMVLLTSIQQLGNQFYEKMKGLPNLNRRVGTTVKWVGAGNPPTALEWGYDPKLWKSVPDPDSERMGEYILSEFLGKIKDLTTMLEMHEKSIH